MNRIDFVYLFDVQDGNPNGDPDAGNLPRVDAETGQGLVTDVCIKRKVRNYVQIAKGKSEGFDIYIKEKAVLGRSHIKAFQALNINIGEESNKEVTDASLQTELEELSLCEGLELRELDDRTYLVVLSTADKKSIKDWKKENNISKELGTFIDSILKVAKPRTPTADETEQGRDWMCKNFYDIRTFGAVMSLKSSPNCGQVRGPIQLTFARSVEPVVSQEHSITRVAVATETESDKQSGQNHTMGRKSTIHYGLYRCHGFISANLAKQTGFSEDDKQLFFEALKNMFDQDHSAARGLMSARKLIVFEHDSELGCASASELFDRISIEKKTEAPSRKFTDYNVKINRDKLPQGVTITELI